jgi:protein-tyrosine phosphatase
MPHHPDRLLALAGTHNIRDLGGYALKNGGQTRWRSVRRGDGLFHLSEEAQARILGLGLRTVIDLRSAPELAIEPNPFREHSSISYHNIPLFQALSPIQMSHDAASERPFDMADRYRDAVDRCQDMISRVLATIADAEDGTVLFHCSAGKDRTGLIAALLLSAVGADEETVIADYALTASIATLLLDRLRAQAIARGTAPELVDGFLACKPAAMRKTLDHLSQNYGGVHSYLARMRIDDSVLHRIRQRLVAFDPVR